MQLPCVCRMSHNHTIDISVLREKVYQENTGGCYHIYLPQHAKPSRELPNNKRDWGCTNVTSSSQNKKSQSFPVVSGKCLYFSSLLFCPVPNQF